MGTPAELRQILDMLTTEPARILGLPDYGLALGGRADLVVWQAERAEEVVSALAACRLVVKAGRVTIGLVRSVTEPWRETT